MSWRGAQVPTKLWSFGSHVRRPASKSGVGAIKARDALIRRHDEEAGHIK
jgi:hypothetical protein